MLNFGSYNFESSWGIQQGDPLGPKEFCLTTAPLAKSLLTFLNKWYLDDATLGGPADAVLAGLRAVADSEAQYGLQPNWSKCEAHVFGGTANERRLLTQQVHTVSSLIRNGSRLGAPLTVEAVSGVLTAKTAELSLMFQRLEILDVHQALFLLRHCFSFPKLMYVLRASPTFRSPRSP